MWTPRGRSVFNRLYEARLYSFDSNYDLFDWNAAFMAACWASDLDVEPSPPSWGQA